MKAKIFILHLLLLVAIGSEAQQVANHLKADSCRVTTTDLLRLVPNIFQGCAHNDIAPNDKRTSDTLFILHCCSATGDLCALTAGCYLIFGSITAEQIAIKPVTNVAELATWQPGMYQSRRGAPLINDGGRATANLYVVDGIRLQEGPDPQWNSRHLRNPY